MTLGKVKSSAELIMITKLISCLYFQALTDSVPSAANEKGARL